MARAVERRLPLLASAESHGYADKAHRLQHRPCLGAPPVFPPQLRIPMICRLRFRCIPIALLLLSLGSRPATGAPVYTEDFSTTVATVTNVDANVGTQNFTPILDFGQWAVRGFGNEINSTNQELDFSTSSNQARGAGVVLSPSLFAPGASDYVVSFDVSKYSGASGNGLFRLYQISNLGPLTSNARVILDLNGGDATSGVLINGSGGGDAFLAKELSFTSNGLQTFDFTYDGTSAVGLVMGAIRGPSFSIDNISIQATAIPEPSTFALFGIALIGYGWSRKRRQSSMVAS